LLLKFEEDIMARKFFYVSAGLFLLALGYGLGARNVGAQGTGPFMIGSANLDRSPCAVDQAGKLWVLEWQTGVPYGPFSLPESGELLAVDANIQSGQLLGSLVYANGNAYRRFYNSDWTYRGNLGGGPVPLKRETLGHLKLRFDNKAPK
jgi:hypothetical protein